MEHRRELFRWAADRVRSNVKEGTWKAFCMTAVEEQELKQVARAIGSDNQCGVYRSRPYSGETPRRSAEVAER